MIALYVDDSGHIQSIGSMFFGIIYQQCKNVDLVAYCLTEIAVEN